MNWQKYCEPSLQNPDPYALLALSFSLMALLGAYFVFRFLLWVTIESGDPDE